MPFIDRFDCITLFILLIYSVEIGESVCGEDVYIVHFLFTVEIGESVRVEDVYIVHFLFTVWRLGNLFVEKMFI